MIFKEFEGAKLKFKEIEEKVSDNEFKFNLIKQCSKFPENA